MVERTTAWHRTPPLKRVEAEASRQHAALSARTADNPPDHRYLTHGLANSTVLRLLHGESQGRPLDPNLRTAMEIQLGADLSRVRVHTGPRAAASADVLAARAYTIGQDIAFGPGEYRPTEPAGQALLAHELTHTVEQARGRTAVGIARQAKEEQGPAAADESLGKVGDAIVEAITQQVAGSGIQQRMLSAAVRAFAAELGRQVKAEEPAARLKAAFRELLIPQNAARFAGGYTAGAVAGLVSPVTDLLGIVQLGEQLPQIAANLLRRAYTKSTQLGQEALELAQSIQQFSQEAPGRLVALLKDPAKIYEAIESYAPKAVEAAGGAGRQGAREIVGFFTAKEEKKETQEGVWHALTTFTGEESITKPGGLIESKATRVRKAVFSTPWSDFGYKVGHAVGAVVSNLLLFIFSEGIGNAISKIAAGLGEIAPLLAGKLAKVGEAITAVEHAIATVIGAVTKLVKPLEEVMGPLSRLLGRLRAFLRRLLGLAETEAAELAARGATAIADREGARVAPKAKPAPPAVKRPRAPAAEATAAETATTTEGKAAEEAATTSAETAPAATAEPATATAPQPEAAGGAPKAAVPAPAATTVAEERAAETATVEAAKKPAWLAEAGMPVVRPRPPTSAVTRRQQAALAGREPSVSPIRPPKKQPAPAAEPAVKQPVAEAVTAEEAAEEAAQEAVVLEGTTGAPVPRPTAMASGGSGGVKSPTRPPKRAPRQSGGTVTPIRRGSPPKSPPPTPQTPRATQAAPETPLGGRTPPAFAKYRGKYSVQGTPDPQLMVRARDMRTSQVGVTLEDFARSNVVVAKVWRGPQPVGGAAGAFEYIEVPNVTAGQLGAEFGFHSEGVLAEQLRLQKEVVLVELYSERIPCWRCAKLLRTHFPEAAVFYTVRERGRGLFRARQLMEAYGLLP